MGNLAFDHFVKKIYVKTTLEKMYWCWATEEGLTTWFLREAIFMHDNTKVEYGDYISPGYTFTWKWHNWDGQEDGKVIKANGKDFVQFTFADGLVDINLEEKNDLVIVTLKQHNIPLDEESKLKIHVGCSNGWTFWLTNLKAYLEHGIHLNETAIDLTENDMSGWVFVNM
jgi:hypothetical protein